LQFWPCPKDIAKAAIIDIKENSTKRKKQVSRTASSIRNGFIYKQRKDRLTLISPISTVYHE
jgi:DNA primase large subunit